ncbi:MAG: HD domain-containing protein [Victivallales bacterium]
MKYSEKLKKLSDAVRKRLESAPGCHDWAHTWRVLHNARIIASGEKNADIQVVEAAAILHDIARPEELKSKGKLCHAVIGSEIAEKFLRKCGFRNGEFIKKVCNCVKTHRYRGGHRPFRIEEKIVYDADKLDSIGAVGVGRAFHFAGRIGAKLHNTEKEALGSKSYSSEDSAYREYLVKLRHIHGKMLTRTGRRIAKQRSDFMHKFFRQLNIEVDKPD